MVFCGNINSKVANKMIMVVFIMIRERRGSSSCAPGSARRRMGTSATRPLAHPRGWVNFDLCVSVTNTILLLFSVGHTQSTEEGQRESGGEPSLKPVILLMKSCLISYPSSLSQLLFLPSFIHLQTQSLRQITVPSLA